MSFSRNTHSFTGNYTIGSVSVRKVEIVKDLDVILVRIIPTKCLQRRFYLNVKKTQIKA